MMAASDKIPYRQVSYLGSTKSLCSRVLRGERVTRPFLNRAGGRQQILAPRAVLSGNVSAQCVAATLAIILICVLISDPLIRLQE
jgi:hypothetical protein